MTLSGTVWLVGLPGVCLITWKQEGQGSGWDMTFCWEDGGDPPAYLPIDLLPYGRGKNRAQRKGEDSQSVTWCSDQWDRMGCGVCKLTAYHTARPSVCPMPATPERKGRTSCRGRCQTAYPIQPCHHCGQHVGVCVCAALCVDVGWLCWLLSLCLQNHFPFSDICQCGGRTCNSVSSAPWGPSAVSVETLYHPACLCMSPTTPKWW